MNRRMRWNQTPPNLDDYHPDCLAVGTGPLQQAPAMDDAIPKSSGNKRAIENCEMHTPRVKHPRMIRKHPRMIRRMGAQAWFLKGVYCIYRLCNHVNDVFVTWTLVVSYPQKGTGIPHRQ